jgi:hypothetical protein
LTYIPCYELPDYVHSEEFVEPDWGRSYHFRQSLDVYSNSFPGESRQSDKTSSLLTGLIRVCSEFLVFASSAITFAYWWFSGDKEHSLIRTATVLVIACPHALGVAIPLVIAISTSLGAQNSLLVKDRLALERARNLDMVIIWSFSTIREQSRTTMIFQLFTRKRLWETKPAERPALM